MDIGGQWIHEASASHNPLVQFCQEELREMIPPLQDNYHVQQQQQRQKSEELIVYNIQTGKRVRTSLAKDASRYFYKGMNEFELSDETINENTSFQDLTADCCVCTVPLGVLKRQAIHFDPPLHLNKRRLRRWEWD